MTIRDLLENASLDALGLLDEEERADFEAAFRSASPEIQAQVRREQRRAADLDGILPSVEQPVGLRAKVMEAVRRAIADVSTPVASLAPVGEGHGRGGFSISRATPVWRAACIGFATATVVLFGAFGWMHHENRQLASRFMSDQTLEDLQKSAGPKALEILAARHLSDVALVPAANDVAQGVTANLYLNSDTGEAVLVCKGLPAIEGNYRLVIEDGSSHKSLQDFQSAPGRFVACTVKGISPEGLHSVAIIGPGSNGGPERTILRVKDA